MKGEWEVWYVNDSGRIHKYKRKLAVCENHTYDSGIVYNEPTLTEMGTTKYTCTKCGDSYNEKDIPKKIAIQSVTITKRSKI